MREVRKEVLPEDALVNFVVNHIRHSCVVAFVENRSNLKLRIRHGSWIFGNAGGKGRHRCGPARETAHVAPPYCPGETAR
jgi:hypothetical protein